MKRNKQTIVLNEGQLREIIKEAVNKIVLNESYTCSPYDGRYYLPDNMNPTDIIDIIDYFVQKLGRKININDVICIALCNNISKDELKNMFANSREEWRPDINNKIDELWNMNEMDYKHEIMSCWMAMGEADMDETGFNYDED